MFPAIFDTDFHNFPLVAVRISPYLSFHFSQDG